jgi:hypothetical protein
VKAAAGRVLFRAGTPVAVLMLLIGLAVGVWRWGFGARLVSFEAAVVQTRVVDISRFYEYTRYEIVFRKTVPNGSGVLRATINGAPYEYEVYAYSPLLTRAAGVVDEKPQTFTTGGYTDRLFLVFGREDTPVTNEEFLKLLHNQVVKINLDTSVSPIYQAKVTSLVLEKSSGSQHRFFLNIDKSIPNDGGMSYTLINDKPSKFPIQMCSTFDRFGKLPRPGELTNRFLIVYNEAQIPIKPDRFAMILSGRTVNIVLDFYMPRSNIFHIK